MAQGGVFNLHPKLSRREALRLMATGSVAVVITACAPVISQPEEAAPESPQTGNTGASPVGTPARDEPITSPAGHTTSSAEAPKPQDFGIDSDINLTSNADFYTVSYHPGDPTVEAETWRLYVEGLVDKPLELSLDDIKAMPAVVEMRTLECISNPVGGNLISNAVWKGVPSDEVLRMAGVQPQAKSVKLQAEDRYHTGIPVDLALHPRSLLVYEMNGKPLPVEHGFPLRCLWPGRYGQKQPKWLTRMELIADRYLGHWESQGWSDEAKIKPNSQIREPDAHMSLSAEPHVISGLAFSNASGVAQVEVSTDDGKTWHAAELKQASAPFTPYVWTEWSYRWEQPEPGSHTLIARVTDGEGTAQQRGRLRLLGGTFPDGTSDMHEVRVQVKKS